MLALGAATGADAGGPTLPQSALAVPPGPGIHRMPLGVLQGEACLGERTLTQISCLFHRGQRAAHSSLRERQKPMYSHTYLARQDLDIIESASED
jgi:hypothetical protein